MLQNMASVVVGFETAKKLRDAGWILPTGLVWHYTNTEDKAEISWASIQRDSNGKVIYQPLQYPDYYAPTASDILNELPVSVTYKKYKYVLNMYKATELEDPHSDKLVPVYGVDYQRKDTIQDARSFLFTKLGIQPKDTESASIAEACAAAWLALKTNSLI